MNESCLSHCDKNIEHLNLKFCKKNPFFSPHMIVIDMTILHSPLDSEKRVFFCIAESEPLVRLVSSLSPGLRYCNFDFTFSNIGLWLV